MVFRPEIKDLSSYRDTPDEERKAPKTGAPFLSCWGFENAGVSPGSYFLGLRQPGLGWMRFPVRVL